MKSKLFFLFFAISVSVFAQKNGHIVYYENYVPNSSIKLNSALIITKNSSYFFNLPSIFNNSEEHLQKYITPSNTYVFKRSSKNEIITREFNPENPKELYYLHENMGDLIKWKIHSEKKEILGKSCQKATCNFRGRSYVAFFSKNLPFSDGPFKYSNLPGLILEIYSLDGFVKYSVTKIHKIQLEIDDSSYDKLKSEYLTYENFKIKLKSIMAEKSKKYNAQGQVNENGFESTISFEIDRIEKN